MPIPKPRASESQDDYISRCLSFLADEGTTGDQAQAICFETWREDKDMKTNALKTVGRTDEELRVANYIVLFDGRDLEGIASPRQNPDGTIGEYFPSTVRLESRFTKAGRLPVDWEHRLAPEGEDLGTLGYVDWSTAKRMDQGVFVERVLDRRNEYIKWLEELIDAGLIGTSSEADVAAIQKADDGAILRWPLIGDTLTVTPMEPRMLAQNVLQAAKALRLIAESPEPEADAEVQEDAEAGKAATATVTEPILTTEDEMGEQLTEERLVEILGGFKDEVIETSKSTAEEAAGKAVGEAEKKWSEKQPVSDGGYVTKDELDHQAEDPELAPYKSLGEQLVDVVKAARDGYRPTPRLLKAAKAISGASETVPQDGGFLVQTDLGGELMRPVYEDSPILSGMRRYTISGNANSVKLYGVDETSRATGSRYGGVRAYRVSEGEEKTSSKPKFREIRLELQKVAVLCYATDEILQDSTLLEQIIGEAARNELRFFMADDVFRGTGAGMPLGIINAGCLVSQAKETGQAADTVVAENVIKMWSRMPAENRIRASWYINQEVEPQLQMMSLPVGTGGSLVYLPPGGLAASPYGALFGRPVVPCEHSSQLGDVGDIILADMSQYCWAEKGGIQSASSIHVRFIYDETAFRFVVRYDGQPAWGSALTPYKGTTTTGTLSPFVTLEERA